MFKFISKNNTKTPITLVTSVLKKHHPFFLNRGVGWGQVRQSPFVTPANFWPYCTILG
jgi:hypothetical protein